MTNLPGIAHYEIGPLVLQLALLLFVARGLGTLALRAGQPAILGELSAGLLLGPSALGSIEALGSRLLPNTPTQVALLDAIGLLGALLLLVVTGMETDLGAVRRRAGVAVGVASGGVAVPFLCGFVLGTLLPDSLLAHPDRRLLFSLFLALTMAISAIPVLARILLELDLFRRDFGQTVLAAALADDTAGWILLAVLSDLAHGREVTAATVLGAVAAVFLFLALSLTAGHRLVAAAVDLIARRAYGAAAGGAILVGAAMAWSAAAHALRLEAFLGALVAGIVFGRLAHSGKGPRHDLLSRAQRYLEAVTVRWLGPIFFAAVGLKVDVHPLCEPGLAWVALLVVAVATVGKVAGCAAGARLFGPCDPWTLLAYGVALNARGAMAIVVATLGLRLEILTAEMFSILVLMAMATSLMTPPLLRASVRRSRNLQ